VVTLDRRKLAAPLFAQAAAFVVVLVIGGFTGHSAKTPVSGPSQGPTGQTSSGQTSPSPSSRTPTPAREHAVKLTVKVVEEGTDGLTVAGSQVKILQQTTLAGVVSGTLNPAFEFATNVPAGAYEVCVNPPIGWTSAVKGTSLINGFICSATDVGSGPKLVTFHLTPQTVQVGQ
jgi:hypothetical protein